MAEQIRRRLYSLYPEQIEKLEEMARVAGIAQSALLRILIEKEYIARHGNVLIENMTNALYYGAENVKTAK